MSEVLQKFSSYAGKLLLADLSLCGVIDLDQIHFFQQ
jgi:hypothetical protein